MKFGLAVIGNHSKQHSPVDNFQTVLEQVRTARDGEFDLINAGHHYVVADNQRFQAIPALSRLAAESGDMHALACQLLPLHHPVEIAEHMATLDVITNGKAALAPIAGYRDAEFDAFGIPKAQRGKRLHESVELIKRLWTEDSVTFDGEFFSVTDCTINPKPVQEPRPPIWIGGNTDHAVKRARETGDAWYAYVQANTDEETLAKRLNRDTHTAGTGMRAIQPMAMNGFVAETDAEAIETYQPVLEEAVEWYENEGYRGATESSRDFGLTEPGFSPFLVGSPETVADKIVWLHETMAVDCLILGMHMPELPRETVLNSVELMGETVIPMVRERLA